MKNCKGCGMMKLTENQGCYCKPKKKKTEKEKKNIKPISDKKKERLKNNWTEWDLFKKIYKKLAKSWTNECVICAELVDEDDVIPSCFPHILPKGKYPEYRYFENNVWFVCWIDHHDKFDEAINNFKEEKWLQELENIIKNWRFPDISDYINY